MGPDTCSDPATVAPVVLGLADVAFPPSRHVLTSAAFATAGAVVRALGAEDGRCRA